MKARIRPALLASLAFAGCASTSAKPPAAGREGPGEAPLEFPDTEVIVRSSMIIHETKLYFEMDRAPREEGGQVVEEPVVARIKREGEVYAAGYMKIPDEGLDLRDPEIQRRGFQMQREGHIFSYAAGSFVVGGFRYPAERNGHLFLLGERDGDFTFKFRGHEITVERDKPWRPAVLYRELQESREVAQRSGSRRKVVTSRVVQEEVWIGPHRIVVFPGRQTWQVNQYRVPVAPDASITIDVDGAVRTS